MHTCEHCGSRVPAGADRCPSCGSARLGAKAGAARPARGPGRVIALGVGVAVLALGGAVTVGGLFFFAGRSEPAPPAAKRAPADGFDAVRARGRLRVAADPDAAPFLVKQGDGWEGFEYAIMNAIAGGAGVPVEVVPATFAELPDRVGSGDADLAIGQLAPQGRELAWSVSYLQYRYCLLVPARSAVRTLAGLSGKRIALYDDPLAEGIVRQTLGDAWTLERVSGYGYLDRLSTGALDGMVYDCPLARHEVAGAKGVVVAEDTLGIATYSVGVAPDDLALRQAVDRVLVDLGNQGLLQKLEERWLGARSGATAHDLVVLPGDTLEALAARELGDAARADALYAANQDILGTDRTALYAGMRLRGAR